MLLAEGIEPKYSVCGPLLFACVLQIMYLEAGEFGGKWGALNCRDQSKFASLKPLVAELINIEWRLKSSDASKCFV